MDDQRFDDLARALAGGRASRRRLLRGLLGAGALVPLLGARPRHVGAIGDADCRAFPPRWRIDNQYCGYSECSRRMGCRCAVTVGGAPTCVEYADVNEFRDDCPRRDECDRNDDCARGEVCIRIGGCCGPQRRNACVRVCTGPDG